jgi:hypothetical protein
MRENKLFVWLISHQPTVLFSPNKPVNQPVVLSSQNKPAPVISHQSNEQAKKEKLQGIKPKLHSSVVYYEIRTSKSIYTSR